MFCIVSYSLLGVSAMSVRVWCCSRLLATVAIFCSCVQYTMQEQFKNILEEQAYSTDDLLYHSRELILSTMERMFPPEHSFEGLATLCSDPRIAGNQALLTYHLVDYFTQLVQLNFVPQQSYEGLQVQTQKLEATIRSHIRLEQEVKIYLQHLQYKIAKYQNYLKRHLANHELFQPLEHFPGQQETQLRRERLSLIRINERLKRELMEKEEMLRQVGQGVQRRQVEERLREKQRLLMSRSERGIMGVERTESEVYGSQSQAIRKRSQSLQKGILINILGNNNEVNYYTRQ